MAPRNIANAVTSSGGSRAERCRLVPAMNRERAPRRIRE
jgi:hypothetical protein